MTAIRTIKARRDATAFLLLATLFGCERALLAPESNATLQPHFSTSEDGFVVTTVQLRPAADSDATMWGELTVFVGVEHPPNPICEHGVIGATVAVCGVIHNPDLQSLGTGDLTATFSRTGGQIVLRFAAPPNPICPTYQVRAASSVPLPEQNPGPPTLDVSYITNFGSIVGSQPGPPTQNPGPPTGTESDPGPPNSWAQPGPPNCEITLAGG